MLVLCLFVMPLPTHADFGDFAGDSDYGGGGDFDFGSDSDYGGSGSSSSDDGDDWIWDIFVYVFHLLGWQGTLIVAVIIIIFFKLGKKKSDAAPPAPYLPPVEQYDTEFEPMDYFKKIDPNFSEAEFKEKLSNFYIHFQQSWQAKDISDLRPYLTDTLYAKSDRQLDAYRKNGQTNHVDRPAVLNVELLGWKKDQDNYVIAAVLNTRIVDYVTDDKTGELVRGNKTQEKFMAYEWRLIRSADKLTAVNTGTSSVTCPYCGANVNINRSAVCEYCDSVIHVDTFDWVVSEIKGISQRTK